jgi:hypothetical protein
MKHVITIDDSVGHWQVMAHPTRRLEVPLPDYDLILT